MFCRLYSPCIYFKGGDALYGCIKVVSRSSVSDELATVIAPFTQSHLSHQTLGHTNSIIDWFLKLGQSATALQILDVHKECFIRGSFFTLLQIITVFGW